MVAATTRHLPLGCVLSNVLGHSPLSYSLGQSSRISREMFGASCIMTMRGREVRPIPVGSYPADRRFKSGPRNGWKTPLAIEASTPLIQRSPADLAAALTDLMTACNRTGKRFPTAKKFAQEIAEGLPPAAAVRLVIRVLEGGGSEAPAMSGTDRERLTYLEQHVKHLQRQLEIERQREGGSMDVQQALDGFESERKEVTERIAELDAERAELAAREEQLASASKALADVLAGKTKRKSFSYEKQPCVWPGCPEMISPQGRRFHVAKHERDSGMTLADAKADAARSEGAAASTG